MERISRDKKRRIYLNIIAVLLCVFMFAAFGFKSIPLMYSLNGIVVLLICLKSKFSLFTIKTILISYVLLPIAYKIGVDNTHGILNIYQGEMYPFQINFLIFMYLIINCLFLNNTKVLLHEKEMFKRMNKFDISSLNAILFSLLAIIFIIIYYPPSFLSSGDRFYHLLPGNFWNHFSVICLIYLLPKMKKRKVYFLPWFFVIGWCVIKSERVDALGLILLLIMYCWHKKVIRKSSILLFGLVSFVLFFIIGYTRQGIKFTSVEDFFFKLLNQSTCADLAYIFNISIDYTYNNGLIYGQTYLFYFSELLGKFNGNVINATTLLSNLYSYPGGIYLLSVPFMNFGALGVIMFSIVENACYLFLFSRKSKVSIIYYLFFLSSIFRYCWYGIEYLETGFIYLIPFTYCVYYLLSVKKNPYGSTNSKHFGLFKSHVLIN